MPPKAQPKDPEPFLTDDAESAFNHFAPLVASIPDDSLDIWNADIDLVRVNARRATDTILPHENRVRTALPLLKWHELLEIPTLAIALGFAAARIFVAASPQEIRARQARLRPARKLTLDQLEILAELNLVQRDLVRNIRANRGPIDEAEDAVAIAALYREHEKVIKNKHPFDDEYLKQLAEDGNWLIAQLLPGHAKREKTEKTPEARLRDQLWTELNRRYDELYKAGVEVWGRRKVDEYIPSLLARQATATKEPEAKPTPSPADPA
jgi:hypothetical protein